LAERARRLVAQAFPRAHCGQAGAGAGDRRADGLLHQFRQRRVAAFDQALAPSPRSPVQCGGFAARVGDGRASSERPDRVQRVVVLAAHVLGQEGELALAGAGRGDAAGFALQVRLQADSGIGTLASCESVKATSFSAEVEHAQRLAPLLAAAGAEELAGVFVASAHR
jgi:hypothetical protein